MFSTDKHRIVITFSIDYSKKHTFNYKLSSQSHPNINYTGRLFDVLCYWKTHHPIDTIYTSLLIDMMLVPDQPFIQNLVYVPENIKHVIISSQLKGLFNVESNHKIYILSVPMLAHAYLKNNIAIDCLVVDHYYNSDDHNLNAFLLNKSCVKSIRTKNNEMLYDILINKYGWFKTDKPHICERNTIECCVCYENNPVTDFKCSCTKINTCISCFNRYGNCPICKNKV